MFYNPLLFLYLISNISKSLANVIIVAFIAWNVTDNIGLITYSLRILTFECILSRGGVHLCSILNSKVNSILEVIFCTYRLCVKILYGSG